MLKALNRRRFSVWHVVGGTLTAEVFAHSGLIAAAICLGLVGLAGGTMLTIIGE